MTLAVLRGVSKVYGTQAAAQRALHGLDLTLYERDYVALMGPSGCGKSTLLHVLGLLDSCTRGRYELMGRDVTQLSVARQAQLRSHAIGFVFQGYNLIGRMPVWRNVALPLLYAGKSAYTARERAHAMLGRLGLESLADRLPAELSGGQQQRVAIARALVRRPALLLADEPTGALDSEAGAQVMQLLNELHAGQRQTLVVVTHDPAVARHAERLVCLRDGRVVFDGPAAVGLEKLAAAQSTQAAQADRRPQACGSPGH